MGMIYSKLPYWDSRSSSVQDKTRSKEDNAINNYEDNDDEGLIENRNRKNEDDDIARSLLLAIVQVQDRVENIKSRLNTLSGCHQHFADEALNGLLKTKELCEESIAVIEMCVQTDSGFTDLPLLPIKLILKFLKIEDKKNLRFVSKTWKWLIDELDKEFQVWKVDLSQDRLPDMFEYFVESDNDLSIVMSDRKMTTDVINFVKTFSHRIVEINAPTPAYSQILNKEMSKVEKMKIFESTANGFCDAKMPAEISTCSMSLKVLTLCDIKLLPLEDLKLEVLQELTLEKVQDNGGLASLLTACAQSLEHLNLRNVNDPDFSDLSVKMCKLKLVKLAYCHRAKQLSNLLLLSSLSLEGLIVDETIYDMDVSLDEQNTLRKLKYLALYNVNGTFTNLLTWNLPSLEAISLYHTSLNQLEGKNFNLSTIEKIYVESFSCCLVKVLNILLPRCGENLEDLVVCVKNVEDEAEMNLSGQYPSLKTIMFLGDSDPRLAEIANRAPNLEDLTLHYFNADILVNSNKAILRKLAFQETSEDHDFKLCRDEVLSNLNKISQYNLEELNFFGCELEIPELYNCQLRVKMLNIEDSSVQGLAKLLEACRDTLQKLIICQSQGNLASKLFVDVDKLKNEMNCLESVHLDGHINFTGLNHLFASCSQNVSKVTLINCDLSKHPTDVVLWPDHRFTNMKILHIYPKPEERLMNDLKSKYQEVTFWFFAPV